MEYFLVIVHFLQNDKESTFRLVQAKDKKEAEEKVKDNYFTNVTVEVTRTIV